MASIYGIMAQVKNGNVTVKKFEPHSCYYAYFRTNSFRKGMNLRIFKK